MTIKRAIVVSTMILLAANISASAEILYRFSEQALFDGGYGPVARVQQEVTTALVICGRAANLSLNGIFGRQMREALAVLVDCPAYSARLGSDKVARSGALSTAYWAALMHGPVPDVDARAQTLMLTYEATDYTRMEWNFCQSRPLYDPKRGANGCFSNDPHSYLTWGPNGATAGNGREIQLILQAIDRDSPTIIDQGFGPEKDAVRRMYQMPDRTADRTLETYLCGIWAEPERRAMWKKGFETIGRDQKVRELFDSLYRSSSLDGGKIRIFMLAYAANRRVPTEIDYAFFKDRSAHTSPVLKLVREAISSLLSTRPRAAAWEIRRAIALSVHPSNQREQRLGRDVAFYVDGATASGLSSSERQAWVGRGPLRASDVGLSDDRSFSSFSPGPALVTAITNPSVLTQAERSRCPAAILNAKRPPK